MKYILDADWIIQALAGHQPTLERLQRLHPEDVAMSLVTIGEIYEGIYYGRDPHKAEAIFHQFLRLAETLPLTHTIMQRFARIRGELRRKGQIIGDFDILIAATALHYDLIVVTRNMRDYQRIPQLRLYRE